MAAPRRTKYAKDALPARFNGKTDDPDIKELHELFDYATDAWAEIKRAGERDMRFIAGDTWEPEERDAREEALRPCVSVDEFGQYVNQIINDVRQHKRAIKVTPMGNGANDQTAALRADLWRQIEYRSNAQQAYTTMFENAVNRSYGYLRLKAEYVSPRSRHRELLIEPIVNPDLVTPDPDSLKPDLSDIHYLFYQESWARAEFKRRFPKASYVDFSEYDQSRAARWVQMERVMLAEWWQINMRKAKVLFVDVAASVDPRTGKPTPAQQFDLFEDDIEKDGLPPGGVIVGDRMADVPKVTKRLTNGLEILEENEWPGRFIPFVGCFGKVLFRNRDGSQEREILSAIRLAEDSAQQLSFYRTCQTEQVGLSSKAPYFFYEGSLSPEELVKLEKSNHEPVGGIGLRMIGAGIPAGVIPPFPQRNVFEPAVQALELLAEGARRGIQAGMGISPLPTSAQRKNEKSGVALKQIDESAQKGTFHFVDNLEMAITRCAVIGDDAIPHFYDDARDLTVRKADDTPAVVRVNDPQAPADDGEYGERPDLGTGEHDHTLSTGPSFESQREAADSFIDGMTQNIDRIAAIVGPKSAAKILALGVKQQNIGPFGDEIAEIIAPPEPEGGMSPEMQQAKQMVEQLMAENAQLKQDRQARIDVAKIQQETVLAKTATEADTKLRIAGMEERIEILGKRFEAMNAITEREHEARMASDERADAHATDHVDRIHEHQRDLREHKQQVEMADKQHGLQSDLAEQSAAHASAQSEQDAAQAADQQSAS